MPFWTLFSFDTCDKQSRGLLSGYLVHQKEEIQSTCQWEKERKKFCILARIWQKRGTSRIHLIPASADLIYLTFSIELLPFSSLLVSLFLCFSGHFQFTWVLYPFGLAIGPLQFRQFCRQQLGLVWNKHGLFQVALQANASAAFSRKSLPVPACVPPFSTVIVAV